MVNLISYMLIFGSITACNSTATIDPYRTAWYDLYGNTCGNLNPQPGCDYYYNRIKIRINQDPFYYYGITYTNGFWYSPTGIMYDQYGNALNGEKENPEESADVISEAAISEKQTAIQVGKIFAQKYALNDDKGILISQTLQAWAVLGHDRARTDSDTNEFSNLLYGVSMNRAKLAIAQVTATQKPQALEELNVDVAAHWGTTPEVSKQILKEWYQDEITSYGIK